MSVVYDVCINFVTDVIAFVLFAVLLKLFYAVFINFKMSNIETRNDVIEDNNNSVFEKSKSIKDISINKEKISIIIPDINFVDKKYEINGKIFNEAQFKDHEKYLRFEIIDSKMASDDASIDLTEQSESSSSTPLSLGIQKVHNGVIINSNVYLSDRNYHTIVSFDDGRGYCGVCETDFEIDYQEHINTEEHIKNLNSHVPLCKYDLCIIRKLQENYHCGVCNQIFDIKKSKEHFASKYHEDKLLFAVNRVSDIMYDLDIYKENKDCYQFNANCIKDVNNINNDFDGFYDASKPENDYESTDESISDIEEIPNPFSYASMAKKPQITPKFIEIDIDGEKMNVRFDSWHMVLSLKSNKYYCMVCKFDGHISMKIDHCVSEEHISKLKKCTIVEKYIGFLIRKVDHRLYHCAHCNNLQLLSDIEDHIHTRHQKRKIKNVTEKNATLRASDLKNIVNDIENKGKIIDNIVFSFENDVKELYIFCAKFNLSLLSYNMIISNYCCICEKNSEDVKKHTIEVSHIENMNRCPFLFKYNCNLIRLIKNGYHCAICNIIVEYDIIDIHLIDKNHVKLLNEIKTMSPTKQLIKDIEINKKGNHINSIPEEINNKLEIDNKNKRIEINEEKHLKDIPKVNEIEKNESIIIEKDENIIENEKKDSIIMKKDKKSIESITDDENYDNIEDVLLNIEEIIFLKRKNVFAKVTLMSYNTLIPTGDRSKYCVLCSIYLDFDILKKHTESRQHSDNIRKYKYLEKYDKHLLRQILHTYHCSICNVMFTHRELNLHITWPIHKQELDKCYKIVKNNRKKDIKNGTKQITIDLQKETLYTTYIEPKIKIGIYYEFSKNNQEISKKSKIVINDGRVLKISWDSWNGFCKTKSGLKCCLCQKELKSYEQTNHSKNGYHLQKLEEDFLNEFNPALIRKINENILNCVTCNAEIPNKTHIIIDHMKGKKHEAIYELLVKDSSECNNYSDCTGDIFTLQ